MKGSPELSVKEHIGQSQMKTEKKKKALSRPED